MKLLIVEDNAACRDLLRSLCQTLASDIHEAGDGEAALGVCAKHHPDCVLMDLRMRPMNGLTATRCIRQRFPGITVVIVTDQDDEQTRIAALEAGASAFFCKDHLADLPQLLSKAFL